ncbi:MAG: pyridoxal phosphate-dependent aminotransferase [Gammaproteobacteria bacterium]|nr:pyridoxal phosphate-dependent aminotransferase [Gammaproteobacteria bacterium]
MNDRALQLSERITLIKPSPTLAVSARAEELKSTGVDILNLSVGEPDFDTPDHIREAAIKALNEGHTRYTAVDGIRPLKQAIAEKFARDNQLNYTLNQILVSCGAKHSIFNAFTAILNPGDEVIIPAPYWVSYPDIVKMTGGIPVIVQSDFANAFKLTPENLKSAMTEKTRAFVINSPSNPSGMAYSLDELKKLAEVLIEYPDVLIVTDDIYEHSLWRHLPFANILNACPELYERCIVVNGVSKTYAMTGFRIGYAAGNAKIIAAMKKVQSQSTSNPTSISQYAALAALTGDQACVKTMTQAFKERHDFIYAALKDFPGFECLPSDGTFYSFPSIQKILSKTGLQDDIQFSEYLLNEARVAVIPGSAFGMEGYIRISYAAPFETLTQAVERIRTALQKLFT